MPSAMSFLLPSTPLPKPNILHSSPLLLPTTTIHTRCRRHHYSYHQCHPILRHRLKPLSASSSPPPSLDPPPPEVCNPSNLGRDLLAAAKKSLAMALFCLAIGASAPFFFPAHFAAKAVSVPRVVRNLLISPWTTVFRRNKDPTIDHEFSVYTRELMRVASPLVKMVKTAKSLEDLRAVQQQLRLVKLVRKGLQRRIIHVFMLRLGRLRMHRQHLVAASDEIKSNEPAALAKLKMLQEKQESKDKGEHDGVDWDKMEVLVRELARDIDASHEIYSSLLEEVEAIDNKELRERSMVTNIAMKELWFVQKQCTLLVQRLRARMKSERLTKKWRVGSQRKWSGRPQPSQGQSSSSRKLQNDMKKELENVKRDYLEQSILPQVMNIEENEAFADPDSQSFISNIKNACTVSSDLQRELEAHIRRKYKRHGDEKVYFARTPDNEVVRGFPEVESKWTFGSKEVIRPKAIRLKLLHGWKQWREVAKARLKEKLVDDTDFCKDYMRQRQENILLDRDRLAMKTWYNENGQRWEMDPLAVPFAISRKLVEHVSIRQDWLVMYVTLKNDNREYFVHIKEYDHLFQNFGGFDGLYMKLLASGTPNSVDHMHIPFRDLKPEHRDFLIKRVIKGAFYRFNTLFWESWPVSLIKNKIFNIIAHTINDSMLLYGFPLVESLLPEQVRMKLGMVWPETVDQVVDSWYLKWQAIIEDDFYERAWTEPYFEILYLIRVGLLGYVIFHVLSFIWKVPGKLGFVPQKINIHLIELQRVADYYNFHVDRYMQWHKKGFDPIKNAFEQMKKVNNPPVRLCDFASIDSFREEINEIVSFLQNPTAFQEIGARAPRGILIVGERGSGKTSLSLAIAAEAKVPVVEVKREELEAGFWVGQSAANIRELFQTAREWAPVIIFVEDFDVFAGSRGESSHTQEQDHEAFINQLLVELDGFDKLDGVVLLATTRNLSSIDEALRRPGRMDRVIHLQPPTQHEREKILRQAAEEALEEDFIGCIDWGKVAEKTSLLRLGELKLVPNALEGSAFRNKFLDTDELLTYCSWFATFSCHIPNWLRQTSYAKKISKWLVNYLGLELRKEDLRSAADLMEPYGLISNGIELLNPPLDWSRETKLPHAVWASGRALIALLLPNFDTIDSIWLQPHSWQGIGCIKITRSKSESYMYGNVETRSYLEKTLVFCFGSHIASQMLLPFGSENFLSQTELRKAQEIATRMVLQYGWGPDDSPMVYFYSKRHSMMNMGNEVEMGAKIEKIYNLAYDKAKDMLVRNSKVLEKLVEDLVEFENLTREDILEILEEYGGTREQEPFFLTEHRKEVSFEGLLNDGNGSEVALSML